MSKKPRRRLRRPQPATMPLKNVIHPADEQFSAYWLALNGPDGLLPIMPSAGKDADSFLVFRDKLVANQCMTYMAQLVAPQLGVPLEQTPLCLVAMKKPKWRRMMYEQKYVIIRSYDQFTNLFPKEDADGDEDGDLSATR